MWRIIFLTASDAWSKCDVGNKIPTTPTFRNVSPPKIPWPFWLQVGEAGFLSRNSLPLEIPIGKYTIHGLFGIYFQSYPISPYPTILVAHLGPFETRLVSSFEKKITTPRIWDFPPRYFPSDPRWRRARSDSPNVGSQGIPESPKFSFQKPCCVNIPMTLNGAGLYTYIWWILMVTEVNIPYIEFFGYISIHTYKYYQYLSNNLVQT